MKTIAGRVSPITLAGLLLTCCLSAAALAEENEPYPQVVVSGEGTAELAPDMAVLQLTVTREAETARQALDANSAAMAQVMKALLGSGVAERDLQTSNFSIQPRYTYPAAKAGENKPPRIVGYTVRNGLTVRVRDLANLGAIMDQSVTLGVNEGGSILFTNDDPSPAMGQARTRAVEDAMNRARTLASAAGVRLGKVLQISEQSYNPAPAPLMRAQMASARSADAVPVAAGENRYRVQVRMSFAIEQ